MTQGRHVAYLAGFYQRGHRPRHHARPAVSLPPETCRAAALTICDQAVNRYDAVVLLTMCGLLGGQP